MSDTTPTAARPTARKDSHWYARDGTPCYEIIGKTTGRPRPVNIADARAQGLLPSVTTIIDSILRKPALEAWKTEQAILACLTAPRKDGEEIDAFIHRVLQEEQQQNQEAKQAADRGTEIHAALEAYFTGQEVDPEIKPWIMPAAEALMKYGKLVAAEKILVGDGYAGKTDLILDGPECWWVFDYKSTKKLPDPEKGGAYAEHRLQCSAYAQAYADLIAGAGNTKPIRTGNLYISSIQADQAGGKFVICEHEEWQSTYADGFEPLVQHWQWANKYRPNMPGRAKAMPALPVDLSKAKEIVQQSHETEQKVEVLKGRKVVWTPGVATKAQ